MTPDERRQAWYREMAEHFSYQTAQWTNGAETVMDDVCAGDAARLAAHFGRLALGETDDEELQAIRPFATSDFYD